MSAAATLLAIDPGSTQSAYVMISDDYRPQRFAKDTNDHVLDMLYGIPPGGRTQVVIETSTNYGSGMPAGKDIFNTYIWVGRFIEAFRGRAHPEVELVLRQSIKAWLCGSSRAKDGNVRQALIDRFAPDVGNHGRGYKDAPGFFYGFAADVWQAYALAVYWLDQRNAESA